VWRILTCRAGVDQHRRWTDQSEWRGVAQTPHVAHDNATVFVVVCGDHLVTAGYLENIKVCEENVGELKCKSILCVSKLTANIWVSNMRYKLVFCFETSLTYSLNQNKQLVKANNKISIQN
jgi:hypothetical protein